MRSPRLSKSHRRRISQSYIDRVLNTETDNLIQLFTLGEAPTKTMAYDASPQRNNGTYTNVTLAQPGIPGSGYNSGSFNGTTSLLGALSAGLTADFNGAEGTVLIWPKPSAVGVWTDGALRYFFDHRVDANNIVNIAKLTTNNTIQFYYEAGGTTVSHNLGSQSWTVFTPLAISWSATDDLAAYYANASQVATDSGLGTWAGSLAKATVGALNVGNSVWSGALAFYAMWSKALTEDQIIGLSTV